MGVGNWGWWLAALAAPKSAIAMAGLLVTYGLGVGWGSVVPASAVISSAIAFVVVFNILPAFWPDNIHYKYWAYTVLALWMFSLAVVSLLAKLGQTLQRKPSPYRWPHQLGLTVGLLLALWVGTRLYQSQWPVWVPWDNV